MKLIKTGKSSKVAGLNLFILAILGLAIVLGFFLVGGLVPENFTLTQYSDKSTYTPLNPDKDPNAKQGLQLDLIKLEGCSSTAAVNFLIDRSGSMNFNGGKKIKNLRNAILSFKNKLSDDNIIGLQVYSETGSTWTGICNPQGKSWCNLINPTPYKNVRDTIHNTVCGVHADGGTYTRDAFLETEKVLDEAIKKYPDHKFNLIFISDGVPEDGNTGSVCPGGIGGPWCGANELGYCRCYSIKQDPTNFYDSSKIDISQRIKDKGVRIFTISYVDKTDQHLNSLLEGLMERVASSVDDYYRSPSEQDIEVILEQIVNKICKEAN